MFGLQLWMIVEIVQTRYNTDTVICAKIHAFYTLIAGTRHCTGICNEIDMLEVSRLCLPCLLNKLYIKHSHSLVMLLFTMIYYVQL